MTDLVATPAWSPVPQLETTTAALGGAGGPLNLQAQALLNRTADLDARANALQLADYTALRAYAGAMKAVYVTGYLVTAAPQPIAGLFTRDDADTTSADNGGTIIVASNGKRWKRIFDGAVNVLWFGAVGDGIANDYAAFLAAHNALPAAGGAIEVPDSVGYKLNTAVTCTRPVRWVIGHTTITGPAAGWTIDLQANGSSIEGAGRGATLFELTAPSTPVTAATATCTINAGAVNAVTITSAGSGYYSTPIIEVSASPTGDDAAIIATVSGGVVTGLAIVAAGSGYVVAPTITIKGGGAGAVKSNEIQGSVLRGFSVDMNGIAHAAGIYKYGGWYGEMAEVEVVEGGVAATAMGIVVDSHTLGVPGPTGSYGGAYVNRFANIYTPSIFLVGHDTSTGTTFEFDTLDTAAFHAHGCIAITMVNPVVQTNAPNAFFDLVNVDGLTLIGGDVEGSGTLFKVRGSCHNIKAYGLLAYSLTGEVRYGLIGAGWDLRLARSNSVEEPLQSGSGGSAGQAYQNTGWAIKHHHGIHYSGDVCVWSTNIKLTSATQGNLDDVANAATAVFINASGQLVVRYANAGANPRTLIDIAQFDSAGLKMTNLPSADPGAGTKRFWYDPADSNRVKFAP